MMAVETAPPSTPTVLAFDRTRLAYDRTLLAWIRTATSLITFGFTIYKFFQYLNQQQPIRPQRLLGPREYGLLMIALGIVSLAFATVQHQRDMKLLRVAYAQIPYSFATLLAGLIALLGIAALVAVIFRA